MQQAFNDYTDASSVSYSYSYTDYDGNSQTKDGTASMTDQSVTVDGNKIEVKYTINSALDDSYFYLGIDGRPVTITYTYEGSIEYNDNGFIKSIRDHRIIDAGDNGKIEIEYSTGGGFLGIGGTPINITAVLGALTGLGVITYFVRRKRVLS